MTALSEKRAALAGAFEACRADTLALFADVGEVEFRRQIHPEFSPLGWHLGHIAYAEAAWLVCHAGGRALPRPDLKTLFDVAGLKDKRARCNLPPIAEVMDYANAVRAETVACLAAADLDADERLWHFVLQHEAQHGETIAFLKHLGGGGAPAGPAVGGAEDAPEFVPLPAGPAAIGDDDPEALDNERPRHLVPVADFSIARQPVSQRQFGEFIGAGGYRDKRSWSEEGWAWRMAEGIERPLYWREGLDEYPVSGISAFEAEAYCRWAGLRLPSEFEWEKAARAGGAGDMLGGVWEWTSSYFAPYPGFESFPYAGYSEAYFDGRHRVLRGGSWASRPWVLRPSTRNWYTPGTRQILAGLRCARDGLGE